MASKLLNLHFSYELLSASHVSAEFYAQSDGISVVQQTPVQKYWKDLLKYIEEGKLTPEMVSHMLFAVVVQLARLLYSQGDILTVIFQADVLTGLQVITHELPLKQAAEAYKMFNEKADGCVKVVLKPWEGEE